MGGVLLELLDQQQSLEKVTQIFRLLGDSKRMSILLYLMKDRELSVTQLMKMTSMEQSALSHQLRVLKDNHLVTSKAVGKNRIYQLKDQHVYEIIKQIIEHVNET